MPYTGNEATDKSVGGWSLHQYMLPVLDNQLQHSIRKQFKGSETAFKY